MHIEQGDIFQKPEGGTFLVQAIAHPVSVIPESHRCHWTALNPESLQAIRLHTDCIRNLTDVKFLDDSSASPLVVYRAIDADANNTAWVLPVAKFCDGRFKKGIKPGTHLPFCNVPLGAPFVFLDQQWGDRTRKPSMHFGSRAFFDYFTGNCCGTVLDYVEPVAVVDGSVIKP